MTALASACEASGIFEPEFSSLGWPPHWLQVNVAKTMSEVAMAWGLVYDVYACAGLVGPNMSQIHTAPQALSPDTAVIYSSKAAALGSTLTVVVDGTEGLPLDRVYDNELDALRRKGRRVVEFGLLADAASISSAPWLRRSATSVDRAKYPRIKRLSDSLVHTIRMAYCYSMQVEATDIMIGVHPKHAPFYHRAYGFVPYGQMRKYPAVNNAPVVLMRCDLLEQLRSFDAPDGLNFAIQYMEDPQTFAQRFDFDPRQIASRNSPIGNFLRAEYPGEELAA